MSRYSHQAVTSAPVSFDDMKKMAINGVDKYWGRNSTNTSGTNILIGGQAYEVFVKAEDESKDALPPIKLTYVTNSKAGRSRNWELSRITLFNNGYLEYGNGWFYEPLLDSELSFIETFAHEIGHEFLKDSGGHSYSKTHKKTSTILQSPIDGEKYPITGEIDLMKYTDEPYRPSDFYSRVVASEVDVRSLIWIGGVK